jgi:hypothetical protein
MTDSPPEFDSDADETDRLERSDDKSGSNGEHRTIFEMAIYVPVGLASLAREAIEKLITEGAERGEVEVTRVRNALENEVEIARSVGKARVRGAIARSSSRFEYPPLSIVAEVVRALGERGREALEELQGLAGVAQDRKIDDSAVGYGGEVGDESEEALRGKGLANLKSAQRTAASRVLKARFGRDGDGANSEVIRATFDDDVEGVDNSEGDTAASKPVPPRSLEDYDSLSAQQVVARLGGLSDEELKALLAYETSTKSRAAVVERVRLELESRGLS